MATNGTVDNGSSSNGNGSTVIPDYLKMRTNASFHDVPLQNLTMEGWLELFLSPAEKRTFSQWRETVQDKSITHRLTAPLMKHLASFVPDHIAPNVITLTGFVCLGQAWYITNKYGDTFPNKACTWFAVLDILVLYCTHSIDMIHAKRIRQSTPLGDLFKYCTDCNATVFLVIVTAYCLGGSALFSWYAVQVAQLVLFTKHLSAFQRNAGLRYNILTGPEEVIISVIFLLAVRATFGLDWFLNLYNNSSTSLPVYPSTRTTCSTTLQNSAVRP